MSIIVTLPGANIFLSDAEVLVNATNAQGVMGGGLALAFRRQFPGYYNHYINEAKEGRLVLGEPHFYKLACFQGNQAIASIHTMQYPGMMGDLPAITQGLFNLGSRMEKEGYTTAAIPALGCGIGRLSWKEQVLPTLRRVNALFDKQTWTVYPPH